MSIKIIGVPNNDISVPHDNRIDYSSWNQVPDSVKLNKVNVNLKRLVGLAIEDSNYEEAITNAAATMAESQTTLVTDGSARKSSEENVAALSIPTQAQQTPAEKEPLERSAAEKIAKTNRHLGEQNKIQTEKKREEIQKERYRITEETEVLQAQLGSE